MSQIPVTPAPTKKKTVTLYSPKFYAYCGLGGILACGTTHTAVTPVDLAKCRMQTGFKYRGVFDGWKQIRNAEGFRGLFKGWGPTCIGYSLQGLCKFGFYELFKKTYHDFCKNEEQFIKHRTAIYLAASASAEFLADIALCPFEAIKVRVQTQEGFAKGLTDGFGKIYKVEGATGLYKSLVPLWLRQIPYTMMKFTAFERCVEAIYKHALSKPKEQYNKAQQLGVSFVGGYIAGVFCALVSHPADVVVSKLNKEKGAKIGEIVKKLGFKGCWEGLLPRIFMIGTLTALQWFIYDSFKVYVGFPTSGGVAKKADEKDK